MYFNELVFINMNAAFWYKIKNILLQVDIYKHMLFDVFTLYVSKIYIVSI